jgi:LEA14-like dessication related protein
MNKKTWYIGGSVVVFALLGRLLYKNIYLANQWDFNIGTFRIESWSPLKITQTIEFINKSNIKVVVKNIKFNVLTQGIKIGSIERAEEQTIQGGGTSKFNVTYAVTPSAKDVDTQSVLRDLGASILAKSDIPVEIVGALDVKTLFGFTRVPITYTTSAKELYTMYKEM